jgi:hypothetical protein
VRCPKVQTIYLPIGKTLFMSEKINASEKTMSPTRLKAFLLEMELELFAVKINLSLIL